jgi:hypothetical protein
MKIDPLYYVYLNIIFATDSIPHLQVWDEIKKQHIYTALKNSAHGGVNGA